MYDYEAQDGDEVSFRDGDIIGTPSPTPAATSTSLSSAMDRHRFDAGPDPDPTFYFVADPDPDPDPNPSFTQAGGNSLFEEKCCQYCRSMETYIFQF
jgi:hypothetical protein